jgi:pimeloyl-ACP methyl ester carboxylesterase
MAERAVATRERAARFGPEGGLTGIVTTPEPGAAPRGLAAVVLSTGVLHRVGTNRLSVDLARALAAAGVAVLRFDLSGVGDSERRRDVESVRESVEADISDALDYMAAAHGASEFVLIGLCSGAFDAFSAALGQAAVRGAFVVDMPGPFRTWRHTVVHVAKRLLRPASWRSPLAKLAGHSRALVRDTVGQSLRPGIEERNYRGVYLFGARGAASRGRMREQLATLLARGVRLHFVFTAGLEHNYNHRSQFRSAFPAAARHPAVSFEFYPEEDHSFGTSGMRRRLVERAVAWTLDGFAGRR